MEVRNEKGFASANLQTLIDAGGSCVTRTRDQRIKSPTKWRFPHVDPRSCNQKIIEITMQYDDVVRIYALTHVDYLPYDAVTRRLHGAM